MKQLLREIRDRVWLFWWHLWTGDANEQATRRRLEEEVRRFGGQVQWDAPTSIFTEP
jgi:hypothetical protein